MSETILQSPEDRKYKNFLTWLVLPESHKTAKGLPLSVPEYITYAKITDALVDSFYKKDSFPDDLMKATISWAKAQTPQMAATLYDRFISTKNSKDFLAFMEFISHTDKKEDKGNTYNYNFINPTKDQYEQIVTREARALNGTASLPEGSSEENAS